MKLQLVKQGNLKVKKVMYSEKCADTSQPWLFMFLNTENGRLMPKVQELDEAMHIPMMELPTSQIANG
jgi:hypothetical protein